jgi:hypothetical protein
VPAEGALLDSIEGADNTSINPALLDRQISIMSGPCDQGSCPDYSQNFDLLYSHAQDGGSTFTKRTKIRVKDCGQCQERTVGTTGGGCWDFTSCGRPQSICIDTGVSRAHRIWKDNGYKACYKLKKVNLGSCGEAIKDRAIWHPEAEVRCTW